MGRILLTRFNELEIAADGLARLPERVQPRVQRRTLRRNPDAFRLAYPHESLKVLFSRLSPTEYRRVTGAFASARLLDTRLHEFALPGTIPVDRFTFQVAGKSFRKAVTALLSTAEFPAGTPTLPSFRLRRGDIPPPPPIEYPHE
jgi:hypothetical protein